MQLNELLAILRKRRFGVVTNSTRVDTISYMHLTTVQLFRRLR